MPRSNCALGRSFLLVGLLILALTSPPVAASSGDRLPEYRACVLDCVASTCNSSPPPLPLSQRVTFWTCDDNCRYDCMHTVTRAHMANGDRIHQFHGKWPFVRAWGLQEPASVLFSLFNLLAHLRGFLRLRSVAAASTRSSSLGGGGLTGAYIANAALGVNTWVWSMVFHSRDRPWTERMDYFSAIGSIAFSLVVAILRITALPDGSPPPPPRPSQAAHSRAASARRGSGSTIAYHSRRLGCAAVAIFYAAHVTYLTLWPFDYGYNIVAGIVVGMLGNVLWVWWCWSQRRQRPHWWKMVVMVVWVTSAMTLELLDFPPVAGVIDAHSLWHAATWPAVLFYHGFFVDDLVFDFLEKERRLL
ncbi:Per1-like protein [Zopfochytrium polystomum]|nr:Per1-like protein [Zopfochytrium polystomum]